MEGSSTGTSRIIEPEDRITALPDSVIQHILSFLPTTKDAARTSILAKGWRRQWIHLPNLIFKPSPGPTPGSDDKYLRFIENTLAVHDSPRIKKFHLYYGLSFNLEPHITSKIRYAVTKCVEDLVLFCNALDNKYMLPRFLIESVSLVRLEIHDCYIKSDCTVNLPFLKSLKMDSSGFSINDCAKGMGKLVSGCPVLESLELSGWLEHDVAVLSKSLKVLSLAGAACWDAIEIACPNLVEFSITSGIFPPQMIENVLLGCPCINSLKLVKCRGSELLQLAIASNSLKELHLEYLKNTKISVSCPNLVKLAVFCSQGMLRQVVNLPSTVCVTLDCDNSSDVNKLLQPFQYLSMLRIGRSLVEIISGLANEDRPPLLVLNSKCLTLDIGASFGLALPGIAYGLGSPMLETLVINLNSKYREDSPPEDYQDMISSRVDYWNSNRTTHLVSYLKTVEITGLYEKDDECEIVLDFIAYLLKNAQVLEKMIVSLEKSRPGFVIGISQKLLSFPRYSACATVELLCST